MPTNRPEERVQRLERELQELTDFLENAIVGLHRIDAEGRVMWANRAELDMLGYAPEEFIGQPVANFVVQPGQAAALLVRVKSGESLRDEHVQMRCKDGTTKAWSAGYIEKIQSVKSRQQLRDEVVAARRSGELDSIDSEAFAFGPSVASTTVLASAT